MSQCVEPASQVTFHYAIKLEDGQVVHNTWQMPQPAQCCLGDGQLPPSFERCLIGLCPGQRTSFTLKEQDAFGVVRPEQIVHMHRHEFSSDMQLSQGLVIAFTRPDGSQIPGVIQEIIGDSVTVDFNHPLAGQTIHFEVEILSIDQSESQP